MSRIFYRLIAKESILVYHNNAHPRLIRKDEVVEECSEERVRQIIKHGKAYYFGWIYQHEVSVKINKFWIDKVTEQVVRISVKELL